MESKGKISFGFKKAVPGIGGSGSSTAGSGSKLAPKPSLFGNDDDNDDEGEEDFKRPKEKKKMSMQPNVNRSKMVGVAGAAPLSRSAKQRTEEALTVDASVFDYDGVYDSMKIGERQANAEREAERKKRDPKYISAFLASSEQRKIDRSRAEAKMIQRERDLEGEEFKDTESFVTDAYKQQMEEMQEAEVKEKEKEEKERSKSKGVAGFYKNYMEENDRAHQAAVAASLNAKKVSNGNNASTTATEREEESKDSEKQRAVEEARKKGLDVRVNDDNEVVDERSLLSAGLNTFGRKKKTEEGEQRDQREQGRRVVDAGSAKRDGAREAREAREVQRQRQSKMIEEQVLELERKREEEAKQEEEERKKTLVKDRRNNDSSVASARERAMERKRKREEDEAERKRSANTAS